jgi:hypothetical protein
VTQTKRPPKNPVRFTLPTLASELSRITTTLKSVHVSAFAQQLTGPKINVRFFQGAIILIPTSMVHGMNAVIALALASQETAPQRANGPVGLALRYQ